MFRYCVFVLLSLNLQSVLCSHGKHNVSSGQFLQNERFAGRIDYGQSDHLRNKERINDGRYNHVRNNTRFGHNLGRQYNTTDKSHKNYTMSLNNHRNNTRHMDHNINNHKDGYYYQNNPIYYNASYNPRNNSRHMDHRDVRYGQHNTSNHYNINKPGSQYNQHRNNSRLIDYRNYQNHHNQRYDYRDYQSDQPHGHYGNLHHHNQHRHQTNHKHNHNFDNNFNHQNITHQNINKLNQTNTHHPSLPNIFGNHSSNNHHAVNLTEEQRAALTQQFLEMTKEFPLITAPQRACPDGFRKDRSGACREIF